MTAASYHISSNSTLTRSPIENCSCGGGGGGGNGGEDRDGRPPLSTLSPPLLTLVAIAVLLLVLVLVLVLVLLEGEK